MCPAAVHFWFNVRVQKLADVTTVGASVLFTAPRNPERIGFLFGSGGGNINYRPTSWGASVSAGIFSPAGANPLPEITIARFGQIIVEPWDFNCVTFPNNYTIWEMVTPAGFKNEVIG